MLNIIFKAKFFISLVSLVSFFTIFPAKSKVKLYKAAYAFSFVGMVIGLLLAAFVAGYYYFFDTNHLGLLIMSILIVLLSTVITGAIHLDGLADCFDAVFQKKSKHSRILHDAYIGTFATLALIFAIILQIAGYYILATKNNLLDFIALIIFIQAVCKQVALYPPFIAKTIPSSNLAKSIGRPSFEASLFSWLFIYIFAIYTLGLKVVLIGIVCEAISLLLVYSIFIRRFNGYNGDVIGALIVVTEIILVIAFSQVS